MKNTSKGKLSYSLLALSLFMLSSSLVLNGCQSNIDEVATKTHGSKAGDGYTYGTGPNKTKPYPQSEPVNINNVGGAKPKNEPYSRGGNKDYTVLGQHYMVWNEYTSYQEVGTASWYGPGFHGNKTSNGEVYDQKGFSAAHKNLPLPSYVKVTNLENGRAVIVRVNDRGPFHGSRIIDLSEGAAKAIDMTKKGTAKVKLELIDVRHGQGNIAQTDKPGQRPIIGGIINSIYEKNTSSTTRKNIDNITKFNDAIQSGNKPDLNTTIAAAGSAIYVTDKVLESIESAPSSSSTDTTITRTITTTTTTVDESGETLTDKNVNVTNINNTTGTTSSSNYEVIYATPPSTSSNTITTTTTTTVPGNSNYAATTVIVESGTPFIQFFSSASHANAKKVQNKVKGLTQYPVIIVSENGLFRVRIGPVKNNELSSELEHIKQLGYQDAFIKRVE